ncbi:polysaccharide biosynthesis protein [Flavobacteriaceae bacterium]|nr:polysaccharide biosynthesis protein [Flavobacteriaceae bacterium]
MLKKLFLKTFAKYASKWLVLLVDIILLCISFILAYIIRFDYLSNLDFSLLIKQIPIIAIVGIFSFLVVGSYKGIVRHTTLRDAFTILTALTVFTSLLEFFNILNSIFDISANLNIPRSIVIINYLAANLLLIISRFIFKFFFALISTKEVLISNVLIYGAGASGRITYEVLNKDKKNRLQVLGFIDDDKNKINKQIDRTKIYKPNRITNKFITDNNITVLIISIQHIKSDRLLEIINHYSDLGLNVKIVPPIADWINGDLQVNQIRDFTIDDLLKRPIIQIDNPVLKEDLKDKVILVTGAAGSIGSEICRQISKQQYRHLVLLDQAESPLYDLQQEFNQADIKNFTAIVANLRDAHRMETILNKYKPQRVFHAAAYKHVPLMEENPYEAVKVNVFGTKIVADLAIAHQVEKFVMISSDKAVNPTNVMGATKRVAEIYISSLFNTGKTKFITTRFGNVLGSNGSVIPLFKKQIAAGGPLTLTHKDITRYFMTIPEACGLVLEAGTMGEGGEIFIFDMGKSVKIITLAKRMIKLSGLSYPDDIDIIYTGLRPGEKLYEELLATEENMLPTHHKKIMIAKVTDLDTQKSKEAIIALCDLSEYSDVNSIVTKLKEIVPEYISQNSTFEKLDAN